MVTIRKVKQDSIQIENDLKKSDEKINAVKESDKKVIDHPQRYGGDTEYECIKVLENWFTEEQFKGFCIGNSIKYLCRLGKKDDELQELKKAAWYINRYIEHLENKK